MGDSVQATDVTDAEAAAALEVPSGDGIQAVIMPTLGGKWRWSIRDGNGGFIQDQPGTPWSPATFMSGFAESRDDALEQAKFAASQERRRRQLALEVEVVDL